MKEANLGSTYPLNLLNQESSRHLASIARKRRYGRRATLFSRGDPAASVYIVAEGEVMSVSEDEAGNLVVLGVYGPQDMLGEMEVMLRVPRIASFITRTPVEAVVLPGEAFRRAASEDANVMLGLYRICVANLKSAGDKIFSLRFYNSHMRVWDLLRQLARRQGDKGTIENRPSHLEISRFVGCSREMASKIMKSYEREGHISVEGSTLTLHREPLFSGMEDGLNLIHIQAHHQYLLNA